MLHFQLITREIKQSSIIVYSRGKENWKESKGLSIRRRVGKCVAVHSEIVCSSRGQQARNTQRKRKS